MRASFITSFLLAVSSVHAQPGPHKESQAIYVLRNSPDNAVIGLPIQKNGLLGKPVVTSTGGVGEPGVDSDGIPAGPDSLFSQGALTVADEYVFAVNPGDNTLSQLKVSFHNPSKLTLVGSPAKIPGEFPNTVAASSKGNLVCVGTTGAKAGVSCTTYSAKGLGELDALRPFDLNQTTPAVGPPNTVSHVLFSTDGSALYAIVKGDGTPENPGFFSVFPVKYGCKPETAAYVSRADIRSSPEGTDLLFGAAIIPSSGLVFVTDPGFGVSIIEVNPETHIATALNNVKIPGQSAICWAAYSQKTSSVFLTDVLVNRLVEVDAEDGEILLTADLPNDDPGLVDLWVVGRHVYALSPGNGTTDAAITVFDFVKNEQVQRVSLLGVGAGPSAMGMAYIEI
ncbi:hypothetical protein BJX63DRAFT_423000 [Aspergillus granulosus]|uniref:3-carboxymuconate cyclase n=1 Tax=Aspergillus granulosus TaxID=176169 RepID=A0ABR4H6V3_9EURO